MPVYTYTAKDTAGGRRAGTVDAKNESLAVDLLKSQNLFVVSLQKKQVTFIDRLMEIRGVSEVQLVAFTRQFSTMISAGLPIARALEVLAEQSDNAKFKMILTDILRDVEGGISLSQALGRYRNVFSNTYTALVAAGEASGKLDVILKRLAQTMEAEHELKAKFRGAMVYPAIVFAAMIGVFVILMIFVIPKLADMYESMDVELPWMTKVMIGVSDIFANYFLIIFLVFVGFVIFVRWFLSTDEGKDMMSTLSFGLPVFGKINKQKELTSFTRTLSLLISSAIPIVEALNIVAEVVKNSTYKEAAREAALAV
ncbi:MAG: type II secretion system F family protein, partial [Patescibacteria group bacterium]